MAGILTGYSASQYEDALNALLPKGPAWEKDHRIFLQSAITLTALELARIDSDIAQLIDESDPRTANITLSQWFKEWGIPDACLSSISDTTISQWQQVLVTKIQTLGYTFDELVSLIGKACGLSNITVSHPLVHDVNCDVDAEIYSPEWAYACLVISADSEEDVRELDVTWDVSRALAEWGNEIFECLVKSLAPAHLAVIFQYQ